MAIQQSDLLRINRNGVDYKMSVANKAKLQPTDLLCVNRNSQDYKVLKAAAGKIHDSDLIAVNRGGVDYRTPWSAVKSLFMASGISPSFSSLALTRTAPGSASDLSVHAAVVMDRGKEPASEVRITAAIFEKSSAVPISGHLVDPGGFTEVIVARSQTDITPRSFGPAGYGYWYLTKVTGGNSVLTRFDETGSHACTLPDARNDPAKATTNNLDTSAAAVPTYEINAVVDNMIAFISATYVTLAHTVWIEWTYTTDGGATWRDFEVTSVPSEHIVDVWDTCIGRDGKIWIMVASDIGGVRGTHLEIFDPATGRTAAANPPFDSTGTLLVNPNEVYLVGCGDGVVGYGGSEFFFHKEGQPAQRFLAGDGYGGLVVSDNGMCCICVGHSAVEITVDGGLTWDKVTPGSLEMKLLRATSLAIDDYGALYSCDPTSGGRAYQGTAYVKPGIYRSTDRGLTWTLVLEAPVAFIENHGTQRVGVVSALDPAIYYESDDGIHWTLLKDDHNGVMPAHQSVFQGQSGSYGLLCYIYNGSDPRLRSRHVVYRSETVLRTLRVTLQNVGDEAKFSLGSYVEVGGVKLYLYEIEREGGKTQLLFHDPDSSHDDVWWQAKLQTNPPLGCVRKFYLQVDAAGVVTAASTTPVGASPITMAAGDTGFNLTVPAVVGGTTLLPAGSSNIELQVTLYASNSVGADKIGASALVRP